MKRRNAGEQGRGFAVVAR
ncbi:hypothetical protein O9992_00855 [Vibrio lentus]|nr:hypothetical protein [Vibrio lentus]